MKKSLLSVCFVITLLFVSLAALSVHAASGVTFYKDANYAGTSVTLDVGEYTLSQMNAAGIPNDWMSSLVLPTGYVVEVYENDNFTGTKWTFTASSSYVGSACNDKMTSVKILAAVFYKDADYAGTSYALQPGSYTVTQMNAAGIPNDWMSSLKVPRGWTVEVYQNDNFTGTKWTFTASSNWVGTACNDQMSSVKIYAGSPSGDWANFQAPTVVFQDQAQGLEGSAIFHAAIPNVEQMMKDICLEICKKIYNSNSEPRNNFTKLTLLLENNPNGVAWKAGDPPEITIGISAQYIASFYHQNGNSYATVLKEVSGMLAHEGTHGYQYSPKNCGNYTQGTDYFGFVEGLADYVRTVTRGFTPARYPSAGGHWNDGYNTTGFFIKWIVDNKKPSFAIELNRTAADYSTWSWDAACRAITGEGVQSLWNQYQQSLQ